MIPDQPFFNQMMPSTQGSSDPLGTAAISIAIYRSIFPSINNVVRYARVYTSLCWMVRRIAQTKAEDPERDLVELTQAGLEKIQLLLIWYNWGENPDLPVPGKRRIFTKNEDVEFDLKFDTLMDEHAYKRYVQDKDSLISDGAHFFENEQYRPGLIRGFQFIAKSIEIPGTYFLTPAGNELADAYESAIEGHEWAEWLSCLYSTSAAYPDVVAMAELLDLRQPSDWEQEAFLKHLYPTADYEYEPPNWRLRQRGITLVMRTLDAETGQSAKEPGNAASLEVLRAAMVSGFARNGRSIDLTGVEDMQGAWVSLQLRQCWRRAMDLLVRCVESWISRREHALEPRQITDCCAGLAAQFASALPVEYRSSVGDLIDDYREMQGSFPTMAVAARRSPSLSVAAIIKMLREHGRFASSEENEARALYATYDALVYCALEADAHRRTNPSFLTRHRTYEELPFMPFCQMILEKREDRPEALMSYILQHHVISQHFRAMNHRTNDAANRYRFFPGDDGLERAAHIGVPYIHNELKDLLQSVLYLLAQCGMAELQPGPSFVITKAGVAQYLEISGEQQAFAA